MGFQLGAFCVLRLYKHCGPPAHGVPSGWNQEKNFGGITKLLPQGQGGGLGVLSTTARRSEPDLLGILGFELFQGLLHGFYAVFGAIRAVISPFRSTIMM